VTVLPALTAVGLAAALAGCALISMDEAGDGWSAAGASGSSLTADDGVIADEASIGIDADVPAITKLDPELRAAVEAAAAAAAEDGELLLITSGWRSTAYQEHLIAEAIVTYGSEEVARRYVAPADRSSHLTGDAVDIGPLDAQFWLMEHGFEYGLCQTYANERWHFELATPPGEPCPPMRADASADWS
jgi:D-alanyl-D-alanine dipeptidase